MTDRESLGRLVRQVWVDWAREQSDPKPSWLVPWEELDEGQREVDLRIEIAVAAGERERIRRRLVSCPACGEIHGEEQEGDHPNKAPWRPRGPNALAFLDELLGDGPLP